MTIVLVPNVSETKIKGCVIRSKSEIWAIPGLIHIPLVVSFSLAETFEAKCYENCPKVDLFTHKCQI